MLSRGAEPRPFSHHHVPILRPRLVPAQRASGRIDPWTSVTLGAWCPAPVRWPPAVHRFAGGGLRPLCWGGPRLRAPRVLGGEDRRKPPSSSGPGHRPFKAAARVRIPLGALLAGGRRVVHGPVEQLGVLATLSRWRSRVQIPSGPLGPGKRVPARSGSSVGMSVRLKSGRSAVRPRP